MVKITKGKRSLIVTNGAYEEIYRGQGWKKASGTAAKAEPVKAKPEDEDDDTGAGTGEGEGGEGEGAGDEDEVLKEIEERKQELLKIPVSNMKDAELKEIAAILGIPLEGKSKSDAKRAVAEAINLGV